MLLAVLLLAPAVEAQTNAAPPKTIRVVTDNDYAPFVFRSESGELQGIIIDQWRLWEEQTGIRAEIHARNWDQALQSMQDGEFDVIDTIVQTVERTYEFDFTPEYATVGGSIFFHRDISGITDLASLKGFPVGVKAGDQHIDRLRERGVTTLISFPNYKELVDAAKQHRINVFVADEPAALYLLHKAGIDRDFRHSPTIFRDKLRRAVRKGDTSTLKLVNDGFAAIDSGEMERIEHKWFGRPVNPIGRYLAVAGYAASAALLVIVGLFAWNRALGRMILQRTAALAESEQRFRQIAENLREVFWLISLDTGALLYISPAYETVWGRPCEELYRDPESFFNAIHPDDRARVYEVMGPGLPKAFEIEYRVVRPDGSVRWIWDRGFLIKDGDRVYRKAGIAEDITDRKSAEDAVRQAEHRVRQIIDTIPAMVWGLRTDGVTEFVNQRWIDYMGISLKQIIEGPTSTIHPDDVDRVVERWQADMAAGRPSEDEMRLRGVDGRYCWFLVRTVPLRDAQGNIASWYGTSTNIEGRKQAEEKLRQSESRLAEAQRIAHLGSWEWDLRDNNGTWSDECYRIFGAEPGDASIGEQLKSLVHLDERTLSNARLAESEQRIQRRDDGERILRTVAHVVNDEHGIHRIVGTTQDVTELRRVEDDLKATSEQLRALSARLQSAREEEGMRIAREIHDELGASLTSLRWDLESVRKSVPDDLREKLTAMLALTDTMIHIVRRIASDLRPAVLDVLGLEEALEWQARQFENRTGIAVRYESTGVDVELSPAQAMTVFRIFQEALTNVLRHAHATRVDVTVVEDTGAFVLMIGDNGRGITENERTGERSLGLLGMRERAHLIGAEIEVSGVEGEGTTVTLRLPMADS